MIDDPQQVTEGNPPAKRSRTLGLLGLRRRPGRLLPLGFTRWGWTLLVVIVGVAGALGFAEYSMQPDFCRSCHLMEPYYQAWHTSTHKGVPCTDCHFEPGLENTLKGKWQASTQAIKWATGTYGSKPHAEVRDSSCMRSGCHEQRLLEGRVKWDVPSVRGGHVTINFDHAPHLGGERRGKQLRCVSCHSQIVQGQHIVVTLDTCFLCHFKGFEHGRHEETMGGCEACHGVPKDKIRLATGVFDHAEYVSRGVECQSCHADVVKGNGAVPKQVCWNCHNQPTHISRYGESHLIHSKHVSDHKVECSSCHVQIEHSLSASAAAGLGIQHASLEAGTCAQCHEQTHGGPAELYRGVGGRGVPDMPSPMSRARVSCIACHQQQKNSSGDSLVIGQTFLAAQESCDVCHGTKYVGVLDNWRQIVTAHLDKAEAAYLVAKQNADAAARSIPSDQQLAVSRLLDDANHNIRLVRLGHGSHNVNYSTALLNVAIEWCQKANKLTSAAGVAGGGAESMGGSP
jgi:nitrate/TMAO reductase-like tetraheme cytochrome c subunit